MTKQLKALRAAAGQLLLRQAAISQSERKSSEMNVVPSSLGGIYTSRSFINSGVFLTAASLRSLKVNCRESEWAWSLSHPSVNAYTKTKKTLYCPGLNSHTASLHESKERVCQFAITSIPTNQDAPQASRGASNVAVYASASNPCQYALLGLFENKATPTSCQQT